MSAERETATPRRQLFLRVAAGLLLGGVLVLAGITKVLEPGAFVEQIHLEGLDFLFSAGMVAVIALTLESGLGLALMLGVRHPVVLVPTAGLVAFFLFLTGRNYWLVSKGLRDPEASCGCFGSLIERSASEAFWQDLFLLLPPLLILVWGWFRARQSLPRRRIGLSWAVGILVGVVTYFSPQLRFSQVATDIASIRADQGFLKSAAFRVTIEGEVSTGSAVYQSEASVEMLIVSPRLKGPVVINPPAREFRLLSSGWSEPDEQGRIYLRPEAKTGESGEFLFDSGGISLNVGGLQIQVLANSP